MADAKGFNVNEYWLKRGRTYHQEDRLTGEYHRLQEQFLLDILREASLPIRRILEVGCGFGRITKLLAQRFPQAHITAVDLSPDQLTNAQSYCAGLRNITFRQYDFYSWEPLPGSFYDYDLAVAVEVFLHQPVDSLLRILSNVSSVAKYIVNVDWSENWPWKTPEHVWIHDYAALYRDIGFECATFLIPKKVQGKQQKLFIAGRSLPASINAMEARHRDIAVPNNTINGDDWLKKLHHAQEQLAVLLPAGSSCILVDDDQWGEEQPVAGVKTIPFLERNGLYWGPPADDDAAIADLERLRREGVEYIAFAWNSFWWLDYYKRLRSYLESRFPCLTRNDRLVVFKLSEYAQQPA